jgi:hypothetical protein
MLLTYVVTTASGSGVVSFKLTIQSCSLPLSRDEIMEIAERAL